MTKITLNNVGSLIDATTAATTINNNSSVIQTAFDNTLSRDGTSPNTMSANLDMNSNRIINVPAPIAPTDIVRLSDVTAITGGPVTISPLPVGGTTNQSLIKNSSTNYDVSWATLASSGGVNVKDFGAKGDGQWDQTTVSITSGSNILTKAASNYPFAAGDVGKQIIVPGAGVAGAALITTISGFTSVTVVSLATNASTTLSAVPNVVIRWGTDDYAAIIAAKTAAQLPGFPANAGGTLYFPKGNYGHTHKIEWAFQNFHVTGDADVNFTFFGTGRAHSWDGLTYNNPQGTRKCSFGWPHYFNLIGNTSCTDLFYCNFAHGSNFKIRGRDAITTFNLNNCVSSVFELVHSPDYDQLPNIVLNPNNGVLATAMTACTFNAGDVEVAGNNTNYAWSIVGGINNFFKECVAQSNLGGGWSIDATSSRNTFINCDAEVNATSFGTTKDWLIAGDRNFFVGCQGGATTSGSTISGNRNTFNACTIQSGTNTGIGNWFNGCNYAVTFTESGTQTTHLNPTGAGAPGTQEASASTVFNKVFNTANINTLRINSNLITAAAGAATITIPNTTSTLLSTSNAVLNATPASPTGTTSTTLVMMGLGVATCRITPVNSTRLQFTVTGTMNSSVASDGAKVQLCFGTGAGPANGAAATGTTLGGTPGFNAVAGGAPSFSPFTVTGIATGLTPGTTYWFDVQLAAITGGTATITALGATANEI